MTHFDIQESEEKDLEAMTGVSHYQMCKLAADKDVTTDGIGVIFVALSMEPNEIMDFVPDRISVY